jgi:MFS family permease
MTAITPDTTTRPGFDRRLLPPMMLGSILNPINSSIIAVALVPIATAFGAPATETAWLVSALYLATSIGQPLVGRLVDTFGPRRLFIIGTALTAIAGVIGVLAPNIGVLVVARIVLGFGTCAGYPASMYLIRAEAKRTGMASPSGVLTALSVATQTIAVIGPTLGGFLIGFGGWRSTFAINIPLGIACVVLGFLVLPKHTALDADAEAAVGAGPDAAARRPRFDIVGILLFAATLTALLLFLMNLQVSLVWLIAVAAAGAVGFAFRELRTKEPFIDVRVFAGNIPLLVTYGRGVLAATFSYCFLYGYTQWLEDGRGLSAQTTGLVLLPVFLVGIIMSILVGRKPQIRGKLIVGGVIQVLSAVAILFVGSSTPIWQILVVSVIVGIPQGIVGLAVQNTVYHQADAARMGASSGLLRTFMYLGAMIASSAGGAFFGSRATTGGMHELAWFMIGAAVLFVVITVVDRSLARVDRAAVGKVAA